jgi:hypothetical protein
MDTLIYELGLYIFILGLVVQSLYRIFDPIIDLIKKSKKIEETKEEETMVQSSFDPSNRDYIYPEERQPQLTEKKKLTWKDLVFPPIIGLIVAWVFLPLTIFDFLPFQPQFPIVSYVMTALVISRISNAEHDTFKTLGQFFMGIVNRIYPH